MLFQLVVCPGALICGRFPAKRSMPKRIRFLAEAYFAGPLLYPRMRNDTLEILYRRHVFNQFLWALNVEGQRKNHSFLYGIQAEVSFSTTPASRIRRKSFLRLGTFAISSHSISNRWCSSETKVNVVSLLQLIEIP